jgi:hypothetical protein
MTASSLSNPPSGPAPRSSRGRNVICCLIIPPHISGDPSLSTFGTWLMEAASLLGVSSAAIGAAAFCRRLEVRRLRETRRDRLDPDLEW